MAFVFLAEPSFEFDPIEKKEKYLQNIPGPDYYKPKKPRKAIFSQSINPGPFSTNAKREKKVEVNEEVGPGKYNLDTSLAAPTIIKNNISKGTYF